MKIKELKKILEQYDDDLDVVVPIYIRDNSIGHFELSLIEEVCLCKKGKLQQRNIDSNEYINGITQENLKDYVLINNVCPKCTSELCKPFKK